MKSDNKNKIGSEHVSAFSKIEKIHPVKMLLYLCLIGISVLFVMLLLAYGHSEVQFLRALKVPFPKFFSVSNVLILGSSYLLSRVPKFYRKDNLKKMSRFLGFTLLLGLFFVLSQMLAWYELADHGVFFLGRPFGSYLYLITALHVLHLTAGILFLLFIYLKTLLASSDGIKMLVFIRDPYRKLQLSLLSTYWHFLGALWLSVYFIFLFMV